MSWAVCVLEKKINRPLSLLINIFESASQKNRFLKVIVKSDLQYTVQISRVLSFSRKSQGWKSAKLSAYLKIISLFWKLENYFGNLFFLKFIDFKMLAIFFLLKRSSIPFNQIICKVKLFSFTSFINWKGMY